MKKAIFALVGPSGSGKSTLIREVIKVLGDKIAIIKSLTTRPEKDELDALFYTFITHQEFRKKQFVGELVEWVKYTDNFYGYEKTTVDDVLKNKHGICAATEHGVIALMYSGYYVRTIKIVPIIPKLQLKIPDVKREKADKERSKLHITYQKEIINSFAKSGAKGGKEKAAKELIEYIKSFTK